MEVRKEDILNLSKMNVYAQRINLGQLILDVLSSGGGGGSGDVSIIEKDSFVEFPNVGNSNNLYIDTSKNTLYRWDSTGLRYYMIGSGVDNTIDTLLEEVELINGGKA